MATTTVTDNPIPSDGDVGTKEPETRKTLTGPRLLHALTPRNLLSFGPQTPPLILGSLNVLIGPNGSGKSNLLEAISLLRSTPLDCRPVILKGGGVTEWIWKGRPYDPASIDVVVANPAGSQPLRHVFVFRAANQAFQIADERIENEQAFGSHSDPSFYYRFQDGEPVINVAATTTTTTTTAAGTTTTTTTTTPAPISQGGEAANTTVTRTRRQISRDKIDPALSILAQRRDPELYPEITDLAVAYDRTRLYREWAFGRDTVFRQPQKADMRNDRLEEDYSNLGLFVNRLRRDPRAKKAVLTGLRDLYEGLTDFDVSIEGGTVQVFFTEGEFTIPATRLSDGSLRYLCLLAILCDPNPPPLIGIEEPELGLHPDILPKLADRMVDASRQCQLIVTTHSEVLVDALSDHAEAVVVCEKHGGVTSLERLEPKDLAPWLEKYRLGQLWSRGQIGGTRW